MSATPLSFRFIPILLISLFGFEFQSFSQCQIAGELEVCKSSISFYEDIEEHSGGEISYFWQVGGLGIIEGPVNQKEIQVRWYDSGISTIQRYVYVDGQLTDVCQFNVYISEASGFISSTSNDTIQDFIKLYYCLGEELHLQTQTSEQNTYVWDINGADVYSLVTEDSLIIEFLESGPVDICAIITNPSGCQYKTCLNVVIIDPGGIDFTGFPDNDSDSLFICKNQVYDFVNTSMEILSLENFKWTVTNEANEKWVFFKQYSEGLSFLFSQEGVYTVTLERVLPYELYCELEEASVKIIVSEESVVPLFCPAPVCSDQEVCYNTPLACTSYLWDVTDEGTLTTSNNDSTVCIQWNNPDNMAMGAILLNVMSCTGSQCQYPTIAYIPIIPDSLDITGNIMICGNASEMYSLPNLMNLASPYIDINWSIQILEGSGDVSIVNQSEANCTLSFGDFSGIILLTVEAGTDMGCPLTSSKEINVYNTHIEVEPNCAGEDIFAELIPASTMPIDWFVYDYANILVFEQLMGSSSLTIPSSEGLIAGSYRIEAKMPGGFPGGCMIDTTFSIYSISPPPALSGPNMVCEGSQHVYRVTGTGKFEWEVIGGTIISSVPDTNFVIINWAGGSGLHRILVRKVSTLCPSQVAVMDVSVQEFNGLMIIGNSSPCPDNIHGEPYSISFDGADNVSWYILEPHAHIGTIIPSDEPNSIDIYWHFAEESDINLVVSAKICDTLVYDTLVVNLTPYNPVYSWPDTICQYEPVSFGAPEAATYKWFINGQVHPDTSDILHNIFSEAGTHYIELQLSDPGNCSGFFSIFDSIVVNPAPNAAIFISEALPCPEGTPFDSICLLALEYPGIDSVSYEWYYDTNKVGNAAKLFISDTGLYSLIVGIGDCYDTTAYYVHYTCGMDTCTCTPEMPLDILSIDLSTSGCGEVEISGSIDDFPILTENEKWIFSPPTEIVSIESGSDLNLLKTFTKPGIYQIELSADWICEDSSLCPISIKESVVIPVISDFIWSFTCIGDGEEYLITLTDVSSAIEPLQPNVWTGDFVTQTGAPQIHITASAGSSLQVNLTQSTFNGYECTKELEITVPVKPALDFDYSSSCTNTEIYFFPELTPSNHFSNATWDFGDGSISHQLTPKKKYPETGIYLVELTIETRYGCMVSHIENMEVDSSDLSGFLLVTPGRCESPDTISFVLLSGGPVTQWQWSDGSQDTILIVTESGEYNVMVSDSINCVYISEEIDIFRSSPFQSGIIGVGNHCTLIDIRIPVSDYTYDWIVEGPSDTLVKTNSNNFRASVPPGFYTIQIKANDEFGFCSDTIVYLTIYGNPDPPILNLDIVSCMPPSFSVSADTVVMWFIGNISAGSSQILELAGLSGLSINARISDEHKCISSVVGIQVPALIDFQSMSMGCDEYCVDSLLTDSVCIDGISGEFEFWEWRLDGVSIPGASGTGQIDCLPIDTGYLGHSISLYVTTEECEEISPSIYIQETDCPVPCPDTLNLIVLGGMNSIACLPGSIPGEELLFLDFYLYLPDGYEYCNAKPVFDDGYFDEDTIVYNPSKNSIHITGYYHITDIPGWEEDYVIHGEVLICIEGDEELSCPATFELASINCHSACAADPCAGDYDCEGSLIQLEFNNGIALYELCITLPANQPEGDCDYEDYWIYVDFGRWNFAEQVKDQYITNHQYCFEFEFPLPDTCFTITVVNECFDELYCEMYICPSLFNVPDIAQNRNHLINEIRFQLFPNPSNGDLVTITCSERKIDKINAEIYDLHGELKDNIQLVLDNGKAKVPIKDLLAGYYIVRLHSDQHDFTGQVLPLVIID